MRVEIRLRCGSLAVVMTSMLLQRLLLEISGVMKWAEDT